MTNAGKILISFAVAGFLLGGCGVQPPVPSEIPAAETVDSGQPLGFFLGADAFSIGHSTMKEIRNSYHLIFDADGSAQADIGGDVFFSYDGNGVLTGVTALSKSLTAYRGVRAGMTKEDALDRLGDPSVEGSLSFCYDMEGNKLDFKSANGLSQMARTACVIRLQTDGGFLHETVSGVALGDISVING